MFWGFTNKLYGAAEHYFKNENIDGVIHLNALVTSGGHGPCRTEYYGEVHKKILENSGYDEEEKRKNR